MTRTCAWGACLALVIGCGGGDGGGDTAATTGGSATGGSATGSATGGTSGTTVTNPSFVTVGVFAKEKDGSYTDLGRDITFEVGVPCFTWDRTSGPHDEYTDSHPHYNASDGNTYVDGTFTWTEFGPEHDQASVEDVCAAGMGGTEKWANWTDYYEEQHGDFDPYYLQIVDAY